MVGGLGVGDGRLGDDGTKCDIDGDLSDGCFEDQHCTALHCDGRATQAWWRAADVTVPLASQPGVAQSAVAMAS